MILSMRKKKKEGKEGYSAGSQRKGNDRNSGGYDQLASFRSSGKVVNGFHHDFQKK